MSQEAQGQDPQGPDTQPDSGLKYRQTQTDHRQIKRKVGKELE